MSMLFGFAGVLCIGDAFSAHHFGVRQEWETGVGLLFVLLAVVIYLMADGDEW